MCTLYSASLIGLSPTNWSCKFLWLGKFSSQKVFTCMLQYSSRSSSTWPLSVWDMLFLFLTSNLSCDISDVFLWCMDIADRLLVISLARYLVPANRDRMEDLQAVWWPLVLDAEGYFDMSGWLLLLWNFDWILICMKDDLSIRPVRWALDFWRLCRCIRPRPDKLSLACAQ